MQAIILGILQGVTELFPISSLGHTVLYPSLFGWHALVVSQSQPESQWLGFVVMLHVGSAIGLLAYFWRDWLLIVRAWFRTLARRRVATPTEKLAWLIVISTIPAGILGLSLEHELRVLLAKPLAAAIFLSVNGVVLFGGEAARRRVLTRGGRQAVPVAIPASPNLSAPTQHLSGRLAGLLAAPGGAVAGTKDAVPLDPGDGVSGAPTVSASRKGREVADSAEMAALNYRDALAVGVAQSTALIAGISRDGVCMTTGLARGLSHETAARFAFLLATPVIFAAGFYKLSDFLGPDGVGIRIPGLLGLVFAAAGAVVSVHWLVRWFRTRNLAPFAVYCLAFGLAMTIYLSI